MPQYRRTLTLLALSIAAFAANAQVPVYEGDASTNGGGYSSQGQQGYGTSGAYSDAGSSGPASAQGQLFMQLQQLQNEIQQLRGIVEVQQNDIEQLKQQSLERYQDLDGRISGLSSSAGSTPGASTNAPSNSSAANGNTSNSQTPAASSEPADPAKEKLYYDAAFDLIKAKDFDKASQAFNAFLRRYPNSQYAGNAQYWLGEVNLAKGDLQSAGQAFARVSQSYPNHNKVPDSLYKLADVERRLGHNDKAKGILQQVVSQFPGSSAAQLAQSDLQRLP